MAADTFLIPALLAPEPLAYDGPGTDTGNAYKAQKPLASYDEDVNLTVTLLQSLANFKSGSLIGATGMCLGGHLALRAAFHKDIAAYVTDIHIFIIIKYHGIIKRL